jgi:uncharacterized protein
MEIKRNRYLNTLISKKHNGLIKVITGLRRCGKSYLLNKLFYKHLLDSGVDAAHIIRFAFDSADDLKLIGESLIQIKKEKRGVDPEKFIAYISSKLTDNEMYYLLLDEIQLLDCFETVLNGYLYKDNVDVFVTGSNARFLSKDVITEFRGRGDEVRMYPLSFAEFMSVYQGSRQDGWNEYVVYGGIPLVLEFNTSDQKTTFLKSLFEETYITDIVGRHNIKNVAEFKELINILSSSIGSLTNPSKLSATFQTVKKKKISVTTINNYIDYLCESFLIDFTHRFDVKGKKYINTPLKYYFTDLGLRNARLDFRQIEETHSMENIIFNELKMRGFNVDVGVVTQYGINENGNSVRKQLEIDFVCNKGSKRYYIQSAYAIPDNEKMEQEQRSLLLASDFFKRIIVTKDSPAPYYNDSGVLVMNIYDFLLNEDSLDM